MKIKKLRIENFQSHKDTIIAFTEGINVIVGVTDSGKSSILRALRKLIRDEPSGKSFISHWAKEMTISLTIEKDKKEFVIKRKVTPSKNEYYLDNAKYGGFNKTIPQEVKDTLNMKLVELETGDILDLFFSDQHELPFMVARGTAGTRSKVLGRIGGLHILDKGIMDINKDIRTSNALLKFKGEESEKLQYVLDDWPDLWHELELVESLQMRIDVVQKQRIECTVMADLYEKMHHIKALEKNSKMYLSELLPKIDANIDELRESIADINTSIKLNTRLDKVVKSINILDNNKLPDIKADFQGIKNQIKVLEDSTKLKVQLYDILKEVSAIKQDKTEARLEEYKNEHHLILSKLGICPTCKHQIGEQ